MRGGSSALVDSGRHGPGGERGTWADWYRQSFQAFAESSGLGDAYEEAGCGAVLTNDCATLMADDIDAFVVWHQENG